LISEHEIGLWLIEREREWRDEFNVKQELEIIRKQRKPNAEMLWQGGVDTFCQKPDGGGWKNG